MNSRARRLCMAGDLDARAHPERNARRTSGPSSVEEVTRRNVDRVLALEAAEQGRATTADRVADAITSFCGSIRFVWITVFLVGGWVVFNLALPQPARIDPVGSDPDVRVLAQATQPEALSQQIDQAVQAGDQGPVVG
jgi:hypothetical protein